MVIYFNKDGRIKHAGLNRGSGRVESKWGMGGLFEHDVFDVPESYGNVVRLFGKIPSKAAIEYFVRFAEEKGVLL